MTSNTTIIGVDEAGRGPLAGPVIASAVILAHPIPGLNDSKKLTAKKREQLVHIIQQEAIAFSYGEASIEEIDELNIHHATLLAMKKAVEDIQHLGSEVWIDGCFAPKSILPCKTFIKGDSLHACISAASILAKVKRDTLMYEYHEKYPEYGFANHKGYGTAKHLAALKEYGPSPIHRMSFAPVIQAKK
jgi:ribonuclease HII